MVRLLHHDMKVDAAQKSKDERLNETNPELEQEKWDGEKGREERRHDREQYLSGEYITK